MKRLEFWKCLCDMVINHHMSFEEAMDLTFPQYRMLNEFTRA